MNTLPFSNQQLIVLHDSLQQQYWAIYNDDKYAVQNDVNFFTQTFEIFPSKEEKLEVIKDFLKQIKTEMDNRVNKEAA